MPDYHADTFSLTVPSGWRDATLHLLLAPPMDDFQPSIVLQRRPAGEGDQASALADAAVAGLQGALTNFKLIRRKDVDVRGRAAHVILYSWEDGQKRSLVQWQTFLVGAGVAHVLTATCLESQVSQFEPVMISIMKSMEPLEQGLDKKLPPAV
jgi:hypothetical protein